MFVYPKIGDIDAVHSTNFAPANYKIDIDPMYFNPISLQHYEDYWYQNSSYLYWSNTASGHLSIAEDSIINKTTPVLNSTSFSVYKNIKSDETMTDGNSTKYEYKVNFAVSYNEDAAVYNIASLLEYSPVKHVKVGLYLDETANNGEGEYIKTYGENYIDLDSIFGIPEVGEWSSSNTYISSEELFTKIEYVDNQSGAQIDVEKLNSCPEYAAIFAIRMKGTPTTNASTIAYVQYIGSNAAEIWIL